MCTEIWGHIRMLHQLQCVIVAALVVFYINIFLKFIKFKRVITIFRDQYLLYSDNLRQRYQKSTDYNWWKQCLKNMCSTDRTRVRYLDSTVQHFALHNFPVPQRYTQMEFAIYVCISFCNTCTGLWLGYSKVGLDSVLVDLLGGALEYGGITECYNTTTLTDEPLNHLIKKRCTRLG